MNWSEYQIKAAEFFSRLGLKTEVEFKVEGARGIHVIDVYASGCFNGIAFNWVVECKAWKGNIPKEKVMALASIVQDVGADTPFTRVWWRVIRVTPARQIGHWKSVLLFSCRAARGDTARFH